MSLLTPNYAPASLDLPWYRQPRFRRFLFVLALLLVSFVIAYIYRDLPGVVRFRHLQNRCMGYNAPADRVVYSELPSDIAKLPSTSPEYWLDLSAKPSNVLYRPSCWVNFESASAGSAPAYPILFLGERIFDGEEKLVCIYFKGWTDNTWSAGPVIPSISVIHGLVFEVRVYSKPGHNALPPLTGRSGVAVMGVPPGPITSLRFFAGQRDLTDASKFTIAYEANGERGVIAGQLGNASCHLQARSGPLGASVRGPAAIP